MRDVGSALVMLLVVGCSDATLVPGPLVVSIAPGANTTLDEVMLVVGLTRAEAPGPFTSDGLEIDVVASYDVCPQVCDGHDGCMISIELGVSARICLPWAHRGNGSPILLAHELGHWYYAITEHDSDHEHTHVEWFAEENSVVARTRDAYDAQLELADH